MVGKAAPIFLPEIMRSATITKDALVRCFQLDQGQLLQLEEWIRRYPDLLVHSPGMLYLDSAMVAVRNVRAGWMPHLRLPEMPRIPSR
ncbi:MAG: hypothetical protein WCF98_08335 [Synechococcus sp. ELA057]